MRATAGPVNDHPTTANSPRLSDDDILERLEAIYEYVIWMADAGAIDFDDVADLSPVIQEMRLRVAA